MKSAVNRLIASVESEWQPASWHMSNHLRKNPDWWFGFTRQRWLAMGIDARLHILDSCALMRPPPLDLRDVLSARERKRIDAS